MIRDTVFIIPVYNEATVVGDVINSITDKYEHVVCVNDGSTDNSRAIIDGSKAYLVDHPINMGQGAALGTGIDFARSIPNIKYFVTFDADGQHRLSDVEVMRAEIIKRDVDIIFGSRFLGSTVNMPSSKRYILKLAIKFSNYTSGLKLTDTHNGLRLFNKKVADEMNLRVPDMAHASEILEIVAKHKFKYSEVPVTIEYTEYSKGKGQSLINAINIAFDTLLRKFSK